MIKKIKAAKYFLESLKKINTIIVKNQVSNYLNKKKASKEVALAIKGGKINPYPYSYGVNAASLLTCEDFGAKELLEPLPFGKKKKIASLRLPLRNPKNLKFLDLKNYKYLHLIPFLKFLDDLSFFFFSQQKTIKIKNTSGVEFCGPNVCYNSSKKMSAGPALNVIEIADKKERVTKLLTFGQVRYFQYWLLRNYCIKKKLLKPNYPDLESYFRILNCEILYISKFQNLVYELEEDFYDLLLKSAFPLKKLDRDIEKEFAVKFIIPCYNKGVKLPFWAQSKLFQIFGIKYIQILEEEKNFFWKLFFSRIRYSVINKMAFKFLRRFHYLLITRGGKSRAFNHLSGLLFYLKPKYQLRKSIRRHKLKKRLFPTTVNFVFLKILKKLNNRFTLRKVIKGRRVTFIPGIIPDFKKLKPPTRWFNAGVRKKKKQQLQQRLVETIKEMLTKAPAEPKSLRAEFLQQLWISTMSIPS